MPNESEEKLFGREAVRKRSAEGKCSIIIRKRSEEEKRRREVSMISNK